MAQEKEVAEYGRFRVVQETDRHGVTKTETYKIQDGVKFRGDNRVQVHGSGKAAKKNAKTLAATLHAAGETDLDALPEEMNSPSIHNDDADSWEVWADENLAVPVSVATAGKAAVAGYLKVVHRERESWIGSKLGVSESTVRQYLSDLRAGRR